MPMMPHGPDAAVCREMSADEQRRFAAAEASAWQLADVHATSDIECNAQPVKLDDRLWYDVRPMLDEREFSAELRDIAAAAIQHVLDRKLFERHPQQPYLLRKRFGR